MCILGFYESYSAFWALIRCRRKPQTFSFAQASDGHSKLADKLRGGISVDPKTKTPQASAHDYLVTEFIPSADYSLSKTVVRRSGGTFSVPRIAFFRNRLTSANTTPAISKIKQ